MTTVIELLNQVFAAAERSIPLDQQEVVIEDNPGVEYKIDRVYCAQGTDVGIDISPRFTEEGHDTSSDPR